MKTVQVQYFALLREQRGLAQEQLTTPAATVAALYDEIRERHHFTLAREYLRVAIDGEFASWETALKGGETLVFLPPMAGG